MGTAQPPKSPGTSGGTKAAGSEPTPRHPYLGEGLAPALVEPSQLALHLPQRLPPLGLRLCPDQVPQPLDRRQVQLPAAEGSARELPGLGGTQPGQAPCQAWGEPLSLSWRYPPVAPPGSRSQRRGGEGRGTGGASPSARSTPLTTAGPPCTCSSAQSSPVKLWGPVEPVARLGWAPADPTAVSCPPGRIRCTPSLPLPWQHACL